MVVAQVTFLAMYLHFGETPAVQLMLGLIGKNLICPNHLALLVRGR